MTESHLAVVVQRGTKPCQDHHPLLANSMAVASLLMSVLEGAVLRSTLAMSNRKSHLRELYPLSRSLSRAEPLE